MNEIKISRNCLEGYLTPDCPTCPYWTDGSIGISIGCNIPVPIDFCPSFKKVFKEDSRNDKTREAEGRA